MISELIARVFSARNIANFRHLTAKSYAEHIAMDEFYNGVIDALDPLVECYIGQFGEIDDLPAVEHKVTDMIEYLREESDWIEVNRNEIANESAAVGNLVDGVTAVYLKAIYKLENLK